MSRQNPPEQLFRPAFQCLFGGDGIGAHAECVGQRFLPADVDQAVRIGCDGKGPLVDPARLLAGLLFELALLNQDLGRLASDLLLFFTQEFAFITLAPDATTGSSIMPQKRNPDVLDLVRGSTATAYACLDEALMITAKLPSGYQRDLQRLKPPLFRGIDLAIDNVDIMAWLLEGLDFVPENIVIDESVHATEEAWQLVMNEGLPFRDAYRRVASRYRD